MGYCLHLRVRKRSLSKLEVFFNRKFSCDRHLYEEQQIDDLIHCEVFLVH